MPPTINFRLSRDCTELRLYISRAWEYVLEREPLGLNPGQTAYPPNTGLSTLADGSSLPVCNWTPQGTALGPYAERYTRATDSPTPRSQFFCPESCFL